MKRVVLRGELGKQFGRIHEFDLNTPAEAIRALCANFEGFQQALISSAERGVGYMVQVGKDAIKPEEELHNPTGRFEDISITPVLVGAGGGFGQIAAGVALIALSLVLPGGGLFGGTVFGILGGPVASAATLTTIATVSSGIGAGLILSGTAQLLSPQPADLPGLTGTNARRDSFDPQNNDPADNRASYIYNGAVNLTAQGNPVPLCYGRMRVGSVVVSAGISTADI